VESLPRLSLARLRGIGQRKWDVIAALGKSAPSPLETDEYLLTAARRLWNGEHDGVVADYFIDASIECLGVDTGSGIRERALDLVAEIRAYLDELRRGHGEATAA
jgi:hypothetical protein